MTKDTQKWGRDTAKERYGNPGSPANAPEYLEDKLAPRSEDVKAYNKNENQCDADKHAAKYDNDTPAGWLRGSPPAGATAKPGFDK